MNQVLEALQQAVTDAAAQVGPAVVGLGRGWGRGSGVVVADGQVLTVAHVLRGDEVAVTFADGRTAEGRVAGSDPDLDVAVIAVDTGDAKPVAWEPGDTPAGRRAGARARQPRRPRAAHDLRPRVRDRARLPRPARAARGRLDRAHRAAAARLVRRSAGGPDGNLLGLNAVRRDGGFILALPADAALRRRVGELARGEAADRPRLGVALAPPRVARRMRAAVGLPERDGLLVRGVVDGSPAARAALERGDLLVRAGDRPLASMDDLFDALDAAGDKLALGVVRGSEERELEIDLK